MSDINAATINATTGFKFPIVTSSSRPSVQTGLTVFNSDTSSFELYDGNDWVAIGGASDLDGSSAAKAAPDAAFLLSNLLERFKPLETPAAFRLLQRNNDQ